MTCANGIQQNSSENKSYAVGVYLARTSPSKPYTLFMVCAYTHCKIVGEQKRKKDTCLMIAPVKEHMVRIQQFESQKCQNNLHRETTSIHKISIKKAGVRFRGQSIYIFCFPLGRGRKGKRKKRREERKGGDYCRRYWRDRSIGHGYPQILWIFLLVGS